MPANEGKRTLSAFHLRKAAAQQSSQNNNNSPNEGLVKHTLRHVGLPFRPTALTNCSESVSRFAANCVSMARRRFDRYFASAKNQSTDSPRAEVII